MSRRDDKYYKKANKLESKLNKKLQIIESNCKLSEEEKYATYKSLLSKVDGKLKSLQKQEDINDTLHQINSLTVLDSPYKGLMGLFEAVSIAIGATFIFASIHFGSPALQTIGGILTGTSSVMALHNALNTEFNGDDSIVEKLATKVFYTNKHCQFALESVKKKINAKLDNFKMNNTELEGAL